MAINALKKLLLRLCGKPAQKCRRCAGAGWVLVYGNYWAPDVCRRSGCGGSGEDRTAARDK